MAPEKKVKDPVCGMTFVPEGRPSAVRDGKTYYFCSDDCRKSFEDDPDKYTAAETKVKDPVCGMTFAPEGRPSAVRDGKTYYFCSDDCRKSFEDDPGKYESGNKTMVKEAPGKNAGAYTCPMHPEIVSDKPGACPKCGMDLVAEASGPQGPCCGKGEEEDGVKKLRNKFIAALVLTLLLMLAMHGSHGNAAFWSGIAQMAAATLVVFGPAFFLLRRGFVSLRSMNLNMFTLITIGILWAYIYSIYALFFPDTLPPEMRNADGTAHLYFEPAAMIACLILLGQLMEARAHRRSAGAIRALLDLVPPHALRIGSDGVAEDVPVADIRVGDVLRIRPGDKIPVDGEVISGSSRVNEAMLTGESMPVAKKSGSEVHAGTINLDGSFDMKALKIGAETLLSNIVELVKSAQKSRAPIQKAVDRIAAWFVPAVVLAAIATFSVWFFVFGSFQYGMVNAIAVLLVACPCALGLATPMSITVGVGMAAGRGIIVRDFEALEKFKDSDVILLDKTGTLTAGRPELNAIYPVEPGKEDQLLALAAALESKSEHPLGRAVAQAAASRNIAVPECRSFRNIPGYGVEGEVEGRKVTLGSVKYFRENGFDTAFAEEVMLRSDFPAAGSAIAIALDGRLSGVLAVSDTVKSDAKAQLDDLKSDGFELVLLTGDNSRVAAAVGESLGFDRIVAEAGVQDKFITVKELQDQDRIVAMVGDGINDAAALAQADVGIAMGSGTDIAMQSASVTLLAGNLAGIRRTWRLSKALARNISENLFLAFAYNIVMIPLAAGVFYHWTGWMLSPVAGSFAMSLSSVAVILNALRLRTAKL